MQQNEIKHLNHNQLPLEFYPIEQHTDVTLNTNKTESLTQPLWNADYGELKNIIKFSLPALDDFVSKSPEIYNYVYNEQTEKNDTLLYETQQQDPVIRQLFLRKKYKKYPFNPSLTIRTNKGLLNYYRT